MNRITRITRRDIINVSIHGFDEMTGADMKEQYPQLASFEVRTINPGDAAQRYCHRLHPRPDSGIDGMTS